MYGKDAYIDFLNYFRVEISLPLPASGDLNHRFGRPVTFILLGRVKRVRPEIACGIDYEIFGEGSYISTNQRRESTVFSLLIG